MKFKNLFILSFFLIQLQIDAQKIVLPFRCVYVLRNDTVYGYEVYGYKIYEGNQRIDSVKISDTLIKSTDGKFWIYQDAYAKYEFKFREKKLSEWFIKYNPIYFNADVEYSIKYKKTIYLNDSYYRRKGDVLIDRYYWWGGWRRKVIDNVSK
ncbi:MAG: hypothetical protein GX638_09195 [Crenarchaeota archaeon]|nr:hypothetical protein [Thermoproteota archaeon]